MAGDECTYMYKTLHESMVEGNKAVGLYYKNYKITLDYKDIAISEDNATVKVKMRLDYNCSTTPDADSSFIDEYTFSMVLRNKVWKINNIAVDSLDSKLFKDAVDQKVKQGFSERNAITEVKNEKMKNIKEMIKYIDGNKATVQTTNTGKNFSICSSFSYNRMLGRNYAQRFTQTVTDLDDYFFYYISSNDCTNFVSQCVWAAYGGYVEGNDAQTISNITNKVRMVSGYPNGWYGGLQGGGGTPQWENVGNFYTYATSSKTYGPKGTGSNNNQPYYNLAPSAIIYGNVIQLKTINVHSDYYHSVYVTYPQSGASYYYQVLVSYHSNNNYNRPLWELIQAFGENSCYMRMISFSTANFVS